MWPFFSCLAAKTLVQPLAPCCTVTAGTALSSGLNERRLAPLARLPRMRMQRSLSQPAAVSVSSLHTHPPVAPFLCHVKHMLHITCCHSPSSPTLSLVCHFSPERLVLTFSWPLVPIFPLSIIEQVTLAFIPCCSSCSLEHLQGYLIIIPQNAF